MKDMDAGIYDGQGIVHPMFTKRIQIMALRESAFCVIEKSNKETECTKNGFGDRTMDACKEYDFEEIRLSELDGTVADIHKKYYGKNICLLLEE